MAPVDPAGSGGPGREQPRFPAARIVESAAFRVTLALFGLFCFSAGIIDLVTGQGLPFALTIILVLTGAVCMYGGYRLACNVADASLAPEDPKSRSGGVGRWLKRILIAVVVIAIPALFLIPAYQGTRSKTLIAETFNEGFKLRTRLEEFYDKRRNLPQDAEAGAFQLEPSNLNRAQSVVWDPAGRRIVITVGEPQSQSGKRFALHAEEREGKLNWTCRTIDLEAKYLPGGCR